MELLRVSLVALLLAVSSSYLHGQQPSGTRQPVNRPKPLAVTMVDGNFKYEVAGWEFAQYHDSGPIYTQGDPYDVEYLPVHYQWAAAIRLPVSSVRQLVVDLTDHDYGYVVTFADGTTLRCRLVDFDPAMRGQAHKVLRIRGRIVSQGYPASIDVYIGDIEKVVFSKDAAGKVVAELTLRDGTTKTGVHDIRFRLEGFDSRDSATPTGTVQFKVGDAILEIPFTDIARLTRYEAAGDILALRTGKSLTGELSGRYVLYGTTVSFGKQVPFVTWQLNVKSVEFR